MRATIRGGWTLALGLCLSAISSALLAQGGPPPPIPSLGAVPVPAANPLTPEKAILGKILFWDAQLSSDDSVACGSCHLPEGGGSDPRSFLAASVHPGLDGRVASADDVRGSIGVPLLGDDRAPKPSGSFGSERQVTPRRSMSVIGAAFSPRQFWDGRAEGPFEDPVTGAVLIPRGGALEIQVLGPILSSVEMAHENRIWSEVTTKLASVAPLALAVERTPDIDAALAERPSYAALFAAAFGSPAITAGRIAMAMASYERTLVPDQTPLDAFADGDPDAISAAARRGLGVFQNNCLPCHAGPTLSDNSFRNIGVRPIAEDIGRQEVTGDPADAGRFKVPSLRNVALRAPYFHNGGFATLDEVIDFYNRGGDFHVNQDPAIRRRNLPLAARRDLRVFLEEALTDPRVAEGVAPFDRPVLRPHFRRGDANADDRVDVSDAVRLLERLFVDGSVAIPCADAADSDDDGRLELTDAVRTLDYLFRVGAPLPYPSATSTGPDRSPDALGCEAPGAEAL